MGQIHIDHAGSFMGKMFLVIIGSYSKLLDVQILPNTSSAELFATHRNPRMIVSDNGTGFYE